MSKTAFKSILQLLELRKRQTGQHARNAHEELQQARFYSAEIAKYATEYELGWSQAVQQGISGSELVHRTDFLQRLYDVSRAQEHQLSNLYAVHRQKQSLAIADYERHKLFRTFVAQKELALKRDRERREEKLSEDDHASRNHREWIKV